MEALATPGGSVTNAGTGTAATGAAGFGGLDPKTAMLIWALGLGGQAFSPKGSPGDVMGQGAQAMALQKLSEANQMQKTKNYVDTYADLVRASVANGGKMTMDSKGMNLTVPHSTITGDLNDNETSGIPAKSLLGVDYNLKSSMEPSAPQLNGSDVSFFSAGPRVDVLKNADLAGLTPEDINNALNMSYAESTRGLDVAAKILANKMTLANIENLENDNVRQWYATLNKNDRTELQKNFEAFNADLVASGKKPISMERYVLTTGNDSFKDYALASMDPNYAAFLIKMKKAGATNVNVSPGQKAFEGEVGKNLGEVVSPQYPGKVEADIRKGIEDTMKSLNGSRTERRRLREMTGEQRMAEIKTKTRISLARQLKAAGSAGGFEVLVGQNSDGSWTFYKKLPNGKAEEIYGY